MRGDMQPLWELGSISKLFPGVKALDGIDLRINAGEVHGLVGENGSGKSTLVKCLSGGAPAYLGPHASPGERDGHP